MNEVIFKVKSSIYNNERPKNLKIFEFTKIINPEHVFVGDNVIIDDFCFLYAKPDSPIKIGSWCQIAAYSSLSGGPIILGNFVGVGPGVRFIAGTDQYYDGALMNSPIPEKFRNTNRKGCVLQDFSYIGANSCIFSGVTIGEGAVIGAGSIIRTDLKPWGVYIMRNSKMIQINTRDKEKTYENAKKFLKEISDFRLLKKYFDN